MNRRDFVQQTALTGTLLLVHPQTMIKPKTRHIGVQLWSVRDVADKDPAGTLQALAGMGYPEVEGYRYEAGKFYTYSPKEFKSVLDQIGIKMTSAHTGINAKHWSYTEHKLNDLAKRTIDDHAAIGIEQLICPGMDEEWRDTERLKHLCEIFNHVGEACQKAGMQFGYHNHDFEFVKLGDEYLLNQLFSQTDPKLVIWEMDLYWVKYANEDPAHWINQYGERIHAFHVKDMADSSRRETIEVGAGTINFENIFRLPKASNVRYFIVELEDYRTTSMQGVDISLQQLKKILARV